MKDYRKILIIYAVPPPKIILMWVIIKELLSFIIRITHIMNEKQRLK